MTCARTCNGDCCVVVGMGMSYRDIQEAENLRDRETLLDMLVPISYEEARKRIRRLSSHGPEAHPDTRRFTYKCNRWDEETRLCTRYNERPEMCSAYPYDGTCDEPGCEYTPSQDAIDHWINGRKQA